MDRASGLRVDDDGRSAGALVCAFGVLVTGPVERVPLTDEQLAGQAERWGPDDVVGRLIAELRASRAREAELLAERGDWEAMARVEAVDRLGALRVERDRLQQRIDKTLAVLRRYNPRPDLNGDQFAELRAILTGTEPGTAPLD